MMDMEGELCYNCFKTVQAARWISFSHVWRKWFIALMFYGFLGTDDSFHAGSTETPS